MYMPPRCINQCHDIIIQHQHDQNKRRRKTCEQIKNYLNARKKKQEEIQKKKVLNQKMKTLKIFPWFFKM